MGIFDFKDDKTVGMVFKKDSRLGKKGITSTSGRRYTHPREDALEESLVGKRVRAEVRVPVYLGPAPDDVRDDGDREAPEEPDIVEGVVRWQKGNRVGISTSPKSSLRFADVGDCELLD